MVDVPRHGATKVARNGVDKVVGLHQPGLGPDRIAYDCLVEALLLGGESPAPILGQDAANHPHVGRAMPDVPEASRGPGSRPELRGHLSLVNFM